MPDYTKPGDKEENALTEIQVYRANLQKHSEERNGKANRRQLRLAISRLETAMSVWLGEITHRLNKITNKDEQATQKTNFFQTQQLIDLDIINAQILAEERDLEAEDDEEDGDQTPQQRKAKKATELAAKKAQEEAHAKQLANAKASKLYDLTATRAKEVVSTLTSVQTKLEAEPATVQLTTSKVAYYSSATTNAKTELAEIYREPMSKIMETSEDVFIKAKETYLKDMKSVTVISEAIQLKLSTMDQEINLAQMDRRQSSLNNTGIDYNELSQAVSRAFTNASANSSRSNSSTRTNKRTYRINELPKFKGEVHTYAEWKREWTSSIIPHEEEEWCIRYIDKNTPEEDNVSHCSTLVEVWRELDAKYSNPTAVSESLIQELLKLEEVEGDNDDQQVVNLKIKVSIILKRLETVGQEAQLTGVFHVVSHVIKLMPSSYQKDLSAMRRKLDTAAKAAVAEPLKAATVATAKTVWDAFIEMLDEECSVIRSYRAHNLTKSKKKPSGENTGDSRRQKKKGGGKGGSGAHEVHAQHKTRKYTTTLSKDPQVKSDQEAIGHCPCGPDAYHTYTDRNGKEKASGKLNDCPKWVAMTPQERADFILKHKCCSRCSSWKHTKDKCTAPATFKCVIKNANGDPCGGNHHAKLHECTDPRIINLVSRTVACQDTDEVVVLHIVKVRFGAKVETLVFMDTGSTCSLITHTLARKLGLKGEAAEEWVQLAGREPELIPVMHYTYDWNYAPGRVKRLNLIGLESITAYQTEYNVDVAYQLFPHVPPGSIDRSEGEVGMLLGQDVASLLPRGGEGRDTDGDLYVMRIPFSTGYVLGGTHPQIAATPSPWSSNAQLWRGAVFPERRINHVNIVKKPSLCTCCVKTCNAVSSPNTFWEAEAVGAATPRRCSNCSTCTICNITDEGRTVQEQLELQMLEKTVKHDPVRKKVKVGYPLIGDTSDFVDNTKQAEQLSAGLWKQLEGKNQIEPYNEQFQAYIDRGTLFEVSDEMIEARKAAGGVINYIGHHAVANDHSKTTPLRLVANSALKNNWSGPTPNSKWAKGPNSLNSLLDVLLRFRSYDVALVFDLSKAYHRLETGPEEMFMRLVKWRFKKDEPWRTWGYVAVGMGDRPAACLLELAKKLGAEISRMTDEEAAIKLVKDGYVDDILTGSKLAAVLRMMGEVTKHEDGSFTYSGTMSRILAEIGFSPKVMVRSYEQDPDILSKMDKVLGVPWDASVDVMVYQLVLNLSKRIGASKMGPDLVKEDIETILKIIFSRRKCLQVVSQLFDPLGLLVAYTIKLKLRLKEIMSLKQGWDDPVEETLQALWRDLVSEVVNSEPITFPRSFKCSDVIEQCELIGLWDGSSMAFGGIVYARWKFLASDEWYCCLVTSKARVHPSGGLTIPRSELQGLVVLVRILDAVFKALVVKPSRITLLGDSSCTLGVIDLNAASLKTFCSNRSLEINTTMQRWGKQSVVSAVEEDPRDRSQVVDTMVDLVNHIPGNLNTADLLTRDTVQLSDLGAGSEWQHGPAFLSEDRSTWPAVRENYVKSVPKDELRKTANIALNAVVKLEDIDNHIKGVKRLMNMLLYSYQLNKVRGIVARFVRASQLRCTLTIFLPLDTVHYEAADKFILWLSMLYTNQMMKKHDMDYLTPFRVGGVWYTYGRIPPDQLRQQTGHTALVLLSARSPLATLVTWAAHSQDHRKSSGDTMIRVMAMGYWIPHGRRLAGTVAKYCPKCRLLSNITAQQRMAQYPPERFEVPTRPFSVVCLDFAAPILIKDTLKRRVSGRRAAPVKVFPLLVVCLHTGSVHPLVCTGYSAADLLLQLEGLFALRGYPKTVITDLGSQLTAAGKVIAGDGTEDVVQGETPIDWSHVKAQTVSKGMKWIHAASGAAWRNGKSEAMMKALKWSFKHMQDGEPKSYPELQVQMLRAGHVVNNRPLGIRHFGGADPDWDVVTPNMLLTGFMNLDSPDPDRYLEDNSIHTRRLHFMEQQFRAWWDAWYRSVFPSLLPLTRWKTISRNVSVGDIVLVLQKKKVGPAGYRYARVSEVFPDSAGLVRTVTIQYRPRDSRGKLLPYTSKKLEEQTMAVQRLIVLLAVEERDTVMCPEVGDSRPRNLFTEDEND